MGGASFITASLYDDEEAPSSSSSNSNNEESFIMPNPARTLRKKHYTMKGVKENKNKNELQHPFFPSYKIWLTPVKS